MTTKKGYKAYLKVSDVIIDVISDFISNLTCIDLSSLEGGKSYKTILYRNTGIQEYRLNFPQSRFQAHGNYIQIKIKSKSSEKKLP